MEWPDCVVGTRRRRRVPAGVKLDCGLTEPPPTAHKTAGPQSTTGEGAPRKGEGTPQRPGPFLIFDKGRTGKGVGGKTEKL